MLAHWMRRLPHVRFTNLYGPTEATIATQLLHVPELPPDETAPIPIGLRLRRRRACSCSTATLRPPVGEIGELYIGGVGLIARLLA